MDVFKQLKEFYWSQRKAMLLSMLFLAAATAVGLMYAFLIKYLVDDIIGDRKFEQVPYLALGVVGVMTVKAIFLYLHGYLGGKLGNRIAYNMRNAAYEKLQYLSFQYYDRAKTGDLMTRLTADLEAIRHFLAAGLAQIINVGLMLIFGVIMMMTIHWKLALITMAAMPILAVLALKFESKVHPAFRSIRRSMADLTTAVQENITGVRTVKSFAREAYEVDKFGIRSDEYKRNHIDTSNLWARYFPVMEFVANFTLVLLLAAGGYFVIQGSLQLGELLAFFAMSWYIIGPMWGLGFHINVYTQSKASGERLLEVLNHRVHIRDKEHALAVLPEQVRGDVAFHNVTFHYPDNQPSIKDLTLDAPAGSVIGLLGGTGSGKSTIIQLLMRAYDVQEGQITLDGVDIRDYTLESLRSQIAVVFQETFLFSSTLRNNLAYGRDDVSMEEIIYAAKLAQAHDFIMELPEGYDTVVGERGLGLSGGQKQRIAIARALIKNPKILILDDSTSAVDMETEHRIQSGFREVMRGRTTFIIAHRISSLKHADEILVLDKGEVVQRGTHESLLREAGPYLDTFNIQYADRPDQLNDSGQSKEQERRWAH